MGEHHPTRVKVAAITTTVSGAHLLLTEAIGKIQSTVPALSTSHVDQEIAKTLITAQGALEAAYTQLDLAGYALAYAYTQTPERGE